MKPAWDAVMADYADHPTKLVADVDCAPPRREGVARETVTENRAGTAAGKPLCDSNGVRGFPTIKYGDPSDLQTYEGGRDEKAIKKFAEEKLVPMCSVKNIDLCSADKKAELEKYMALDTEELAKLITAQEDELKQIEEEFKKSVESLQKLYEGYTKDKEEKMAKLKDGGLGLMKSVKASRKGTSKDEL